MKKIMYILASLLMFSCGKSNQEKKEIMKKSQIGQENQLTITVDGDSLEQGFWRYNNEDLGLSKKGVYKDGFKVGEWEYKIDKNERTVEWKCFDKQRIKFRNIKFNYPRYLKVPDTIESPKLFIGDIVDSNKNTYIVLLEYDLKSMNSSVYDYLYQVNQSREDTNNVEVLKSKKVSKYYFKNVEIFKFYVEVEREKIIYNATSYIFEVNNYLYDLTYKNVASKITLIDAEILNDIVYSMECNGADLFTYNTGQYSKVENVEFE